MSGSTFEELDALPYIDQEINDESMRRRVDQLVEDEMKTFQPRDYLTELGFKKPEINLDNCPLLAAERDRIEAGQPMPALDTSRYALPTPSDPQNLKQWEDAITNAEAQLEHQHLRLMNLFLYNKYGPQKWARYNQIMQGKVDALSQERMALRDEITDINRRRKMDQVAAGSKLESMESEFQGLVRKNMEIEAACLRMEEELGTLHASLESRKRARAAEPLPPEVQLSEDARRRQESEAVAEAEARALLDAETRVRMGLAAEAAQKPARGTEQDTRPEAESAGTANGEEGEREGEMEGEKVGEGKGEEGREGEGEGDGDGLRGGTESAFLACWNRRGTRAGGGAMCVCALRAGAGRESAGSGRAGRSSCSTSANASRAARRAISSVSSTRICVTIDRTACARARARCSGVYRLGSALADLESLAPPSSPSPAMSLSLSLSLSPAPSSSASLGRAGIR
eukprot:gnl/Trimastix_PCT/2448.p1 GENE.gnl/Trimastix_PCT/2448~~gnl/Trimastix_PCT/2448.p1  ORF type:complete len:457 (-),score=118.84 gnl/Trimastix_PCT/2448:721-2091(-)